MGADSAFTERGIVVNNYTSTLTTAVYYAASIPIGTLTPAGNLLRPGPYGIYSTPDNVAKRNQVNEWLPWSRTGSHCSTTRWTTVRGVARSRGSLRFGSCRAEPVRGHPFITRTSEQPAKQAFV